MPAMYPLTSGCTSTRGGGHRGPTNTWTGPTSASRTIQFWLSWRLSRCLTGLGRANASRSAVTAATVAPVPRLPVWPSSAAKRPVNQSAGSAPGTANVRSRQTSRKPSPATSPVDPGPLWSTHQGNRAAAHVPQIAGRVARFCARRATSAASRERDGTTVPVSWKRTERALDNAPSEPT